MSHAFTHHPGRNPIEQAQSYLCANQPGFKLHDRLTQIRLASQYVREQIGPGAPIRLLADKVKDAADVIEDERRKERGERNGGKPGTRYAALESLLAEHFEAAMADDLEATAKLLEGLAARANAKRSKGGSAPLAATHAPFAAYPGRNDIERAQHFLLDQQPGFRQRDRATQIRLAAQFVRTGSAA
jgi:hypothetical protein